MLLIDSGNTNARVTMREILSSGRRWVSNPIAFASFMSGLTLTSDLLLDKRLRQASGASQQGALFRSFMHEMLPSRYDARHLDALGGRFALRLTGLADFTVIVLNRRVVTLSGLPVDDLGGETLIDAEMGGDVFMALLNDMFADLSARTLNAISARNAAVPALAAG